jgi:hypothetical protein
MWAYQVTNGEQVSVAYTFTDVTAEVMKEQLVADGLPHTIEVVKYRPF